MIGVEECRISGEFVRQRLTLCTRARFSPGAWSLQDNSTKLKPLLQLISFLLPCSSVPRFGVSEVNMLLLKVHTNTGNKMGPPLTSRLQTKRDLLVGIWASLELICINEIIWTESEWWSQQPYNPALNSPGIRTERPWAS